MSIRLVHGSLGVVCAVGLAVAGMGWQAGKPAKAPAPKLVYCNIAQLINCHPASDQLARVSEILTRKPGVIAEESVSTGQLIEQNTADRPLAVNKSRSELKAFLQAKTQQELAKISQQLNSELEIRLGEKRQELEEQSKSVEAELKVTSESELAQQLRDLDEENRLLCLNTTIKLNALKSRLAIDPDVENNIKSTICSMEEDLKGAQVRLVSDERTLSNQVSDRISQVSSDRRKAMDKELSDATAEETQRIDDVIRSKSARLKFELGQDESSRPAAYGSGPEKVVSTRFEVGTRAARARFAASREFACGLDRSSIDMLRFRQKLIGRIDTELESAVRRIARENGYQVTFTNKKTVEDKTQWFRSQLPYATAGKQTREVVNERN